MNLPDLKQIAVINRKTRGTSRWPLSLGANLPMALDEADHRLFMANHIDPLPENEMGEAAARTVRRVGPPFASSLRDQRASAANPPCSLQAVSWLRLTLRLTARPQDWALSSSNIARTLVSRDFLVNGLCSKNLSGSVTPARLMRSLAYPDMNRIARFR